MIQIEKEFGQLKLTDSKGSKVVKQDDNLESMFQDPSKFNPYWFKILEVIQYGPKYFNEFKKLCDQASIEAEEQHEIERKQLLEEFIQQKNRENADTEKQEQQQDHELVKIDYRRKKLAEQQKLQKKRFQQAFNIVKNLDKSVTCDMKELANAKKVLGIRNMSEAGAQPQVPPKPASKKVDCGWTSPQWNTIV